MSCHPLGSESKVPIIRQISGRSYESFVRACGSRGLVTLCNGSQSTFMGLVTSSNSKKLQATWRLAT